MSFRYLRMLAKDPFESSSMNLSLDFKYLGVDVLVTFKSCGIAELILDVDSVAISLNDFGLVMFSKIKQIN